MNGERGVLAELEALLDDGQVVLAQDVARRNHEEVGEDPRFLGLYALALVRSGAAEAAAAVLADMAARAGLDEDSDRAAYGALRQALGEIGAGGDDPAPEDLRRRLDAAQSSVARLMARGERRTLTPEALTTLADGYLELSRRTSDPALMTRAARFFADAAGRSRRARPAAMALLIRLASGEPAPVPVPVPAPDDGAPEARDPGEPHALFWRAALAASRALETGRAEAAAEHLAEARSHARPSSHRVTVLRELLSAAVAADPRLPAALTEIFEPPRIVVFAGAPFDRPDAPPYCPADAESALREAIRARLEALKPDIGYASAACGSDLLFLEAMLERGAETHIVLPFERRDFEAERVGYLGPIWSRRFDIALRLATSVTSATPGPCLGDEALYRFGNQALQGAAIMRGRQFGVSPDLLAVWDMNPGGEIGGVSDFIDRWADMTRLHIIDLDDVRPPPPPPPPAPAAPTAPAIAGGAREIRALLMSDIVGSSRVTEAQMPLYARFLNRVGARLAAEAPTPTFANTWGDAVFATAPSAMDLARYALTLKASVLEFGDLEGALETPLGMRISLNAGPVLETEDAIAGRLGNFGAEIVRAARIEPVTTPNHIYATDPFVSLLLAEENEARTRAEAEGRPWASAFEIEYIGRVALAKNAGAEGLHHLSAARARPEAV